MDTKLEIRSQPQSTSQLEELPTEILLMIIELLGPDDVKSLHSVSRLLNTRSEQSYTSFFFETIVVFIEFRSLKRLDAISRDDVCRLRVQRVVLSLFRMDLRTDPGSSPSAFWYGNMMSSLTSSSSVWAHPEQQWALESSGAATMICSAIGQLENCKTLAIKISVTGNWYAEGSWDEFKQMVDFHKPKNPLFKRQQFYESRFTLQVLQIALAALDVCHQVKNIDISEDEFGDEYDMAISTDMLPSRPTHLDGYQPLNHVRSLGVRLDDQSWQEEEDSMDRLQAFLLFFPALESLCLNFIDSIRVHNIHKTMESVSDTLVEIIIASVIFDERSVAQLIKNERLARMRRLTLHACKLDGGFGVWMKLISLMCDRLNLEYLRLERCDSDYTDLSQLGLKPEDRKWLIGDERPSLEYTDVNKSTSKEVLSKFRKDTMGKAAAE